MVAQLSPTITPMGPEPFLSLLHDGETKAKRGSAIGSGHAAPKCLLPFPWIVGLGQGWPGCTVCPALRVSAHSLPQPSLSPLGSPLQAPGLWPAVAGSAMQEADPAVWAINSSRSAVAGRKLHLMAPGLWLLPLCRSTSRNHPSSSGNAKAEACVHRRHCAAGLLCDLWALTALSVPLSPWPCVQDASVLPGL